MSVKELFRKKASRTERPSVWNPKEEGEWCLAEVIGTGAHPYDSNSEGYLLRGQFGGPDDEPSYERLRERTFWSPRNVNLVRLMEQLGVKQGDWVYIEYVGKRKISGARSVKDYIVSRLTEDEVLAALKPSAAQGETADVDVEELRRYLSQLKSIYGPAMKVEKLNELLAAHERLSKATASTCSVLGLVDIKEGVAHFKV